MSEGVPPTDIVAIVISEFRGLREDVQEMSGKLSEMVGVMRNHEKALDEMKSHGSRLDRIETRAEEAEKSRRELKETTEKAQEALKQDTERWKARNQQTIMGIVTLVLSLFGIVAAYVGLFKH